VCGNKQQLSHLNPDIFTEEFIKKNMQECYLTAVIIMDSKGNLIAQEYTDEYGADELNFQLP